MRLHAGWQGPAWEAQCHADTHLLLAALKALPLDPNAASGNLEHLATLCSLRFADPSPSGYTIPGQMPSPPSSSTPPSAQLRASPRGPSAPSPSFSRAGPDQVGHTVTSCSATCLA
jgi:hypothetical protein